MGQQCGELPWNLASFNILSAAKSGRVEHISRETPGVHVLALQSTGLLHGAEPGSIETRVFENHVGFFFAPASGAATNKRAGVGFLLHKRRFRKQMVRQTFSPPKALAGRLGAVRIKSKMFDFFMVNAYAPQEPRSEHQRSQSRLFYNHLARLLDLAPVRSMVVVFGDFNASLLAGRGNNFQGQLLEDLCARHRLAPVDTGSVPSFYSADGKRTSKPDHVLVPRSFLPQCKACIATRVGDRLQYVEVGRRHDHRPVLVSFRYRLWEPEAQRDSETKPPAFRYSFSPDLLAREALYGDRRVEVCSAVEDLLLEEEETLDRYSDEAWPDNLIMFLQFAVSVAVQPFFEKVPCAPVARTDSTAALLRTKAWLQQRACENEDPIQQAENELLLRGLQKQIRKGRRDDYKNFVEQLVVELDACFSRRDLHMAWRLVRKISSRALGPKFRSYRKARATLPDRQQVLQHLEAVPSEGGCGAIEINGMERFSCSLDPPLVGRPPSQEVFKQAEKLFSHCVRFAKKLPVRGGCPYWSLPNALWKILLCPQFAPWWQDRSGLGFVCAVPALPRLRLYLVRIFYKVLLSGRSPFLWNMVSLFQIDKVGGCGFRDLGCYDVLGKLFYKTVWKVHGVLRHRSPWNFGYQKHRRREQAIMVQQALAWRLRSAGRSFVRNFYDLRNAFWSPPENCVVDAVRAVLPDLFFQVLRSHILELLLFIEIDGESEVFVHPTFGVPPGGPVSSDIFLEVFNPLVNCWGEAAGDDFAIPAECASLGLAVPDVSLTGYADDLARLVDVSGLPLQCIEAKVDLLDSALSLAILPANFTQNGGKLVRHGYFTGKGAKKIQRGFYQCFSLPGVCSRLARYLGPVLAPDGVFTPELECRFRAASVVHQKLGLYWRHGSRRLARIVFKGAVVSTLLSGVVAQVPSARNLANIDLYTARFARKLFAKKAAGLQLFDDGSFSYDPVANSEVFKMVGWSGAAVEIRLQRLRFWQRVAMAPQYHALLLCAVFGRLPFEEAGFFDDDGRVVGTVNPWASLFVADMCSLEDSELAEVVDLCDDAFLSVFKAGQARDAFLLADFAQLRSAALFSAIPPPGLLEQAVPDDQPDLPFTCELLGGDGLVCGLRFATLLSLRCHQGSKKGGQHGSFCSAARANRINWCLACEAVFVSIPSAKQHVRISVKNSFCRGEGTAFETKKMSLLEVPSCAVCGLDFAKFDSDRRQKHLLLHFPIELSERNPLMQTLLSSSEEESVRVRPAVASQDVVRRPVRRKPCQGRRGLATTGEARTLRCPSVVSVSSGC